MNHGEPTTILSGVSGVFALIGLAVMWLKNKSTAKHIEDTLHGITKEMSETAKNDGEKTRQEIIKITKEIIDQAGKTRIALTLQSGELQTKLLGQGKDLEAKAIQEIRSKSDESLNVSKNAFIEIRKLMDEKLLAIGAKTEETIQQNFKEATENFQKVLMGLAKMDEVRQEMQNLSSNVTSLDKVLSNNKSIGMFGEVQLQQILQNVFGESDKCYKMQYELKTKDQYGKSMRPDAVLFLPEQTGMICIDSKFPLDSYKSYVNNLTEGEFGAQSNRTTEVAATHPQGFGGQLQVEALPLLNENEVPHIEKGPVKGNNSRLADNFRRSVKARVDEVSKYIVAGETAGFAIMFIPSEAIFAEIIVRHCIIQEYAQEKNVYIASPTTLMAIANSAQAVLMKIQMSKNAEQIKHHLGKLSEEFMRYTERWDRLEKQIKNVSNTASDINVTNSKIIRNFQNIQRQDMIEGTVGGTTDGALDYSASESKEGE